MSEAFQRIIATLVLILITGCADISPSPGGDPSGRVAASGGTSVVIGRVAWFKGGVEKAADSSIWTAKPQLQRLEDGRKISVSINKDGRFTWTLEPGTYVIRRLVYRDLWSGNYPFNPGAAFRVPEAGNYYYIGALRSDLDAKRDLLGGLSGRTVFRILDEGRAGYSQAATALGISPSKVKTSLMTHQR